MAIDLGALTVRFEAQLRSLDAGFKKVEERLRGVGERLQRAGVGLTIGLTAPILAGATAAFKAAAGFDKAFTKSTAIIDSLSDTLRTQLADTAREVAQRTTFSAEQVAEAYFFLASAGLNAQQSLAALPQIAAFATAGQFDLATATSLAANAQSALGIKSVDASENLRQLTRVTDVLVKANKLADATTQQFSEALTNRAAAAARIAGKDIEEVAAVLAVLADQGIKGAEAGTRFDVALRDLQTKAITNAAAFKEFNVQVFDSFGRIRNTADVIEDLENAFRGLAPEQIKATLLQLGFADRSVSAIQALIGSSKAIRNFEKELRDAGGTVQNVSDRQLDNLADKFTQVRTRARDVLITIGQALAPAFEVLREVLVGVIDRISTVAEAYRKFPESIRVATALIAAQAAAIGPLLLSAALLTKAVEALVVGVRALSTALLFLAKNPLVILAIALGTIVASLGFYAIKTKDATEETAVFASELERLIDVGKKSQESIRLLKQEEIALEAQIKRLQEAIDRQARTTERDPFFDFEKILVEVQKRLAEVRREIAGVSDASKDNTISQIWERVAISVDQAEAKFKATGDAAERLNAIIAAETQALNELLKVLPPDDETVQSTIKFLEDLRKKLADLSEQERAAKATSEFENRLEALRISTLLTADAQDRLQGQLSLTTQELDRLVLEAVAAGRSFEDIISDESIKRLVDSIRELQLGIRQFSQDDLQAAGQAWNQFVTSLQITAVDLVRTIETTFNTLVSGLAQAAANAIIFTQDIGEAALGVLKNVAAQLIATILQLLAQQLAAALLGGTIYQAEVAQKVAGSAARAGAAAVAAGIESLGLIGLAAAPGLAAAGIAAALAGASSGAAAGAAFQIPAVALAEGGIAIAPTLALIGERGPEAVIPLDRASELGQPMTIILQLDGRQAARVVVPYVPGVVRRKIGKL